MKLHFILFRDLMVRLGWRFPALIVWTALVGISESGSVVLLLPLLSRIGVAAVNTQGAAIGLLNEGLAYIGATGAWEILVVIIVVATIQMVLSIALNMWTARLARHYQSQRQLEMFSAFMRAKWNFITERKAGEMTNAIVTESDRLGRAFTTALSLLASAMVTVIYVALAMIIAWQATLSLVGFALAAGLAMAHLYKQSYAIGRSLAPLDAELQSVLEENFAGVKFIKASASDRRAAVRIEPLVRKLEKANALASALPGTVRGLLEYVALIGLAIVLVLASNGLGVAGGNVVVVLALFGRLFPRITAVQAQMHYLNSNVHAIEAINGLQSAAETAAEREGPSGTPLKVALPSALAFQNLQVKFEERTVLGPIDLTFQVPGVLAIVGRSGAGKSTLVHSLLGLVDPKAGSIRLGSHELATTPLQAWRRVIGYVPQETILFHASIWENLILVNPEASRAEVDLAVRRAHASEFITALPKGYDTIIGDQGVKLSGGQRQRLGIARALLMNPILLVLDEAMSALDAESESELLKTIEELRSHLGILIVAHRLGVARTADSICLLEAGQIVETGTWNELIARKSRLYSLVTTQSLDPESSADAPQERNVNRILARDNR